MSGPNAPPMNGMPKILPPGQTNKPLGAERIPQGGDVPIPSRAALQIRAANKAGVNPDLVRQQPGYRPPPSYKPAPAGVPAGAGVPLPRPRPDVPNELDTDTAPWPYGARTQVPLPRPRPSMPPTGVIGARTGDFMPPANAAILRDKLELLNPTMRAREGNFVQPSNADALRAALEKRMGTPVQTGTMTVGRPGTGFVPIPVPTGPVPLSGTGAMDQGAFDAGKKALAAAIVQGQMPRVAMPEVAPRADVKTGSQPAFDPSQQVGKSYYQVDPNATYEKGKGGKQGKAKDKPLKPNKDEKGNSLYYYRILGTDPTDATGTANALKALQKKAREEPWLLSTDEDALLASMGEGSAAFNKSLRPEDVQKRFQGYEEKRIRSEKGEPDPTESGTSKFVRPRAGDPAAVLADKIYNSSGAPTFQGNRMPTQQDVNAGKSDPTSFKTRFPDFKSGTKPADDTVDDEED